MYKSVEPKLLREGDWLVRDLKVGNRTFKARFDGLTKEEIKFIQRSKKKILIKDGLPFVPSFLIAFFVYSYFYDVILKMVFGLIFG
jgi:prepilin signal peptidase PulO-like enzyme (type II secretory pathway)